MSGMTDGDHAAEVMSGKSAEAEVERLEKELAAAKARVSHAEFPKWVDVHESHIVRRDGHVSVPRFPDFHVDRDSGKVTVLVNDADHARSASEQAGG